MKRGEPTKRKAFGVIQYAPGRTLPLGSQLSLNYLHFMPAITDGPVPLKNWDIFRGVLLALHFAADGHQRITGSAVMVGPGIALAASHVVELEAPRMAAGAITGVMTAITPTGLMIWHPGQITCQDESDVAIVTATCVSDLPTGNVMSVASMSSRIPRIGERIMICGFRAGHQEFAHTPSGDEIGGDVYVSTGRVTQVFPERRDAFLVPWPAIEVDCYTLGSMSGGPAFNEEGRLIGVLATSLDSYDRCGPSYVSLIGPAMSVGFRPVWPIRALNDICFRGSGRAVCELE